MGLFAAGLRQDLDNVLRREASMSGERIKSLELRRSFCLKIESMVAEVLGEDRERVEEELLRIDRGL